MTHLRRIKLIASLAGLFLVTAGCTGGGDNATNSADKVSAKPKAPWVMELQVIPSRLTINPDRFYAKPFTVRAKYSNAIVKNVSKTVQWVSENTDMLSVSKNGELIVTGQCEKAKCPVFLVGTDPESGKSVRVTVHVKQKETPEKQSKKKAAEYYLS